MMAEPISKTAGRTLRYGLFRACERVSPLDIYGKPADMLTAWEMAELIAFDGIRQQEGRR